MSNTVFQLNCEWKEMSLIELAEIIPGFAFKSNDFGAIGEIVVKIKDINPPIIDLVNADKVNTSNYDKLKLEKYLLQYDDYVIAMTGATIGKVGRLKVDKSALINQRVAKVKAKKGINNDFIYYSVSSDDFQIFIQNNIDSHSAQENISGNSIGRFPILLPPLPEQTAIASVLSSLDDKIDLLHRQNATLEKMAETLFRQWFVEEAKEEWEEGKLSDLVLIKYGKDHKKLLDGKIPVYGSGGLMRYADKYLYDQESVLIPRKGTLNNVMYQDEPFWTVDTMFYAEMKVSNIAKFVYHFLRGQDLASMNVGSAVPSMTTEILNNMLLDIPSNEVLEKFETVLKPMYSKTKFNQTQIRTLTALRDTLLPKLMSGEVKVNL